MSATPKRRKRGALRLVQFPTNKEGLLAFLAELTKRAEKDDLLAIATVEVGPGGEVQFADLGGDAGYRHLLVAGSAYLQRHLLDEE